MPWLPFHRAIWVVSRPTQMGQASSFTRRVRNVDGCARLRAMRCFLFLARHKTGDALLKPPFCSQKQVKNVELTPIYTFQGHVFSKWTCIM